MKQLSFYQRNQFNFEIVSSLFSLSLGALAIYFVYRWGMLLMNGSKEIRDALLGKTISDFVGENSNILVLMTALYLGFKFLMLIISASDWQQYLIFAKKRQERKLRIANEMQK